MAFIFAVPCMQASKQSRPVVRAADFTKWGVSLAAAGGLVAFHDVRSLLVVGGAIGNAGATKVLKKVINKPRPDSEQSRSKESSGMPSSHASSLSFFTTALVALHPGEYLYLACFVAGLIATSWRVGAGYHTWPQVIAGFLWGSGVACLWVSKAMPALEPAIQGSLVARYGPWPLTLLVGTLGISAVLAGDIVKLIRKKYD